MQIIRKTGAVSGTAQALDAVGGRNELMYDMEKTMKYGRSKRNNSSSGAATASGDSTAGTGREMRGLEQAISTNRVTGSAGTVALTETVFNDQLQAIWNARWRRYAAWLLSVVDSINGASANLLLPTLANYARTIRNL
jgi:hypothetical protein